LIGINDANNTKKFRSKSGETRFSMAVTAKHKSKIETIGAIQYGEMTMGENGET
jgi:hypothetical protein